ncbi:hypothetical protein [Frigidibacter sp.]|uniref:hypothetical protein n=1 Tax=Frigidibacter sp. TaxID=2586418 RepID=UPI002736CF05|nr:hypothetical protein [Frigidibacter sp.]MDP3339684.1 hypothetical protein [Frigidibacter sp.]
MQTPTRPAAPRDGINSRAATSTVPAKAGTPPTPEQIRIAAEPGAGGRPEIAGTGAPRPATGGRGLRASGRALGILIAILLVLSVLALL